MNRQAVKFSIFGFVSTLGIFYLLAPSFEPPTVPHSSGPIVSQTNAKDNKTNPLDGCLHVYLDVGSNVGIQVRKLFEPELYPKALVLQKFNDFFGDAKLRKTPNVVCSVGFEPNPNHSKKLKGLIEFG